MKAVICILPILAGLASTTPASAQAYCGTFRKCPEPSTVPASERCWAFYRVSAESFSAEEVAPIKARCEELAAEEIEAMKRLPIDLGPPSILAPSPPNRLDELEQQVEDLQERIEELEGAE